MIDGIAICNTEQLGIGKVKQSLASQFRDQRIGMPQQSDQGANPPQFFRIQPDHADSLRHRDSTLDILIGPRPIDSSGRSGAGQRISGLRGATVPHALRLRQMRHTFIRAKRAASRPNAPQRVKCALPFSAPHALHLSQASLILRFPILADK